MAADSRSPPLSGPVRVLHLRVPKFGLRATLVIDSLACGPAIGGLRIAPDVTLRECLRLARAMTLKNAAAGLPHGGAKAVIAADPGMPAVDKEALLRAFAHAIGHERDYIAGPDMGSDETCMGWIHDEIGRAVGRPAALGGIPLDELGATGWGLAHAAEAAAPFAALSLKGARVAIQGFGAVGRHAAVFLAERGAVLVGAADSRGALVDPAGLDVAALARLKADGGALHDHPGGVRRPASALLDLDCDIWIPAARPDAIALADAPRLRARLVLPGANIPMSVATERALAARGVLVVPDFIANAGGVICAAMEHAGATAGAAFQAIGQKVAANVSAVLEAARRDACLPREAAIALAIDRLARAMRVRRFGAA